MNLRTCPVCGALYDSEISFCPGSHYTPERAAALMTVLINQFRAEGISVRVSGGDITDLPTVFTFSQGHYAVDRRI